MTALRFSLFSVVANLDKNRELRAEKSSQTIANCCMEGATLQISSSPSTSVSKSVTTQLPVSNPHVESVSLTSAHTSADGPTRASSHCLAFVYGTLKRGFGNHWLMEELMEGSHAQFLGYACTKRRFPLVCGPFQVPFLLASPSPAGHHVRGELYQVDAVAISRLDELEGVSKGHYERRPIEVRLIPRTEMGLSSQRSDAVPDNGDAEGYSEGLDVSSLCSLTEPLSSCRLYMEPPSEDDIRSSSSSFDSSEYLRAEAYFACADYGLRMADCAPHIPCYTEEKASTYVRRKDRPRDRSFLEHVHAWIEEQS